MDPVALAILAMLVGLFLVVAEFFLPSGGLISVLAAISFTAAVWFAWQAWGDARPAAFWSFIGVNLVLVPVVVIGTLYFLPRTALGRRVLLQGPRPEDVAAYEDESRQYQALVGQSGETLSLLNPGGMIRLNGERYHCESPGLMIDPRTPVRVVGVNGSRLVVVPDDSPVGSDSGASSKEPTELADVGDGGVLGAPDTPLDFEIPQG